MYEVEGANPAIVPMDHCNSPRRMVKAPAEVEQDDRAAHCVSADEQSLLLVGMSAILSVSLKASVPANTSITPLTLPGTGQGLSVNTGGRVVHIISTLSM